MIVTIKDYLLSKIRDLREYKKDHPREFYLLIVILLIGAFLRLYRIDEYMTFLGDEGRDVIVVRRLLVDFDLILIGPGTSIGNMYLGPLYYYLISPALLLANFSPVGPAVMVALLGVVTIAFVWKVAREWFSSRKGTGEIAGLIAASLYAVSPVIIRYSQSSWNPNIMPFFALLMVYSIWRVWQNNEFRWLIITGISGAFVLQSHYLGLILFPVVGLIWLLTKLIKKNKEELYDTFIKNTMLGTLIFVLLMSPLVIFDARHGWINFKAMETFFTERQTTVSARPWTAIPDMFDNLNQILTTIFGAENEVIGLFMTYVLIFSFILYFIFVLTNIRKVENIKKSFWNIIEIVSSKNLAPYTLIFIWIIAALFGFGVYKQHVYAHYYGFLYPAPVLLFGGITQKIWNNYGKVGKIIVVLVLITLLTASLSETPIRYPPNRQLQRTKAVSEKIIREAGEDKFNLAVLAERNYEGAYQYFLEKEGSPIVMIDPQRPEETVAEQLFVVCELPERDCDPVHNDKTEIANFGWSEIDEQWAIVGVNLYKLVHVEE